MLSVLSGLASAAYIQELAQRSHCMARILALTAIIICIYNYIKVNLNKEQRSDGSPSLGE